MRKPLHSLAQELINNGFGFKPEWNVISADSGNAAKELFKEHPQITHIVTDKNMRDGNARQILNWVSEYIAQNPSENRTFKGAVVYSSWEDGDYDRLESSTPRSGVGARPVLDPKDEMAMRKLDHFIIKGVPIRMLRKSDMETKSAPPAPDRSSRLAGLPAPPSSDPWLDAVGRHLDSLSNPRSPRSAGD